MHEYVGFRGLYHSDSDQETAKVFLWHLSDTCVRVEAKSRAEDGSELMWGSTGRPGPGEVEVGSAYDLQPLYNMSAASSTTDK